MIELKKNAFTLIELLVVITILGILIGVTVTIMNPVRNQNIAEESINKLDMQKIAEGLQAYYFSTNALTYPTVDEINNTNGNKLPLLQLDKSDFPENLVYKLNTSGDEFCLCMPSLVNEGIYLWYKSSSNELIESTDDCNANCD